jgi:hypothetical protein
LEFNIITHFLVNKTLILIDSWQGIKLKKTVVTAVEKCPTFLFS